MPDTVRQLCGHSLTPLGNKTSHIPEQVAGIGIQLAPFTMFES